jgi:hypothetical protein
MRVQAEDHVIHKGEPTPLWSEGSRRQVNAWHRAGMYTAVRRAGRQKRCSCFETQTSAQSGKCASRLEELQAAIGKAGPNQPRSQPPWVGHLASRRLWFFVWRRRRVRRGCEP